MQGFALFIVMLFLCLFSLLSLNGLERILQDNKVNQARWQYHVLQVEARNKLLELENELLQGNIICHIKPDTDITQQTSLYWWQRNACSEVSGLLHFLYVTELLETPPCVGVYVNKQLLAAHYYRITLYTYQSKHPGQFIMQSVLTLPGAEGILCSSGLQVITKGVQVRR